MPYAAKTRRLVDAIVRLPRWRRFSLHEPEAAAYDAIVLGSDEVWNFRHPWYGSKPIFFGDGLKAERLISNAASFGNHSAWDGIHPEWARKLGRFSAISVRNENSFHLVGGATDSQQRDRHIARVNFIERSYELRRKRSGIGVKYESGAAALIIDGSSAVFVAPDRLQLGACNEALTLSS